LKPASSHETLLLFVRYPEAGRVKTRLIPRLGPEGAARVYRRMAEAVAKEVEALERPGLARLALVEPAERLEEVSRWLGPGFAALPQVEGDLGKRLQAGFAHAFAGGSERVAAIGADCLDLSRGILEEAFDRLRGCDAVLGPALDGGYYLIGLARPMPELFREMAWSTAGVLQATLERIGRAGARASLLPALRDLDTPEDLEALLPRWRHILGEPLEDPLEGPHEENERPRA
jgi:rSAM/selenodomain-associated transferase 1